MQLPNFLIVGEKKSATTSLHEYLRQHPQVFMPAALKETNYFAWQPKNPNFSHYTRRSFPIRTLSEYVALFAEVRNETAIGEASPVYLRSPVAARNIKALIPEVKLIVSLRNPVDRHYSGYLMEVRAGREKRPIEQAIREDIKRLGDSSCYNSLVRWYEEFDKSRIKVILFEDIKRSTVQVVQSLFNYLDVDTDFVPDVSQTHNKGGVPKSRLKQYIINNVRRYTQYRSFFPERMRQHFSKFARNNLKPAPPMPQAASLLLQELYEEDIHKVGELTGIDLTEWLMLKKELAGNS